MPELTLPSAMVPTPSPPQTAASSGAANTSNTAATAPDGVTASTANEHADTPFAAVLQKQIADQPTQDAAARDVQALLASLQADVEIKEEAPIDAISLLAPMLAGIVPIKADTSVSGETDIAPIDVAVVATDLPVPVAAPVTVAANITTVAPVASEGSAQETGVTLDLAAGKATQDTAAAAIIAAATAATDEAAAADRKKSSAADASFDALIDAAASLKQSEGAQQRAAPTAGNTAAKPVEVVPTPVGAHGWADDVGDKLSWMVGRKETRADLVLTPPQLGRIEVSITLNGDQASASFVAASPAVREALENAVPRLREILQDAGISLGQTQVGAESFQQQANRDENGDNRPRGNGFAGGDADTPATIATAATTQWLRRGNGLVDLFA